ncbi:UNVERIFIED_CONTAM: hypothetical protein GTU68_042097 [Idotea baltica]|nr:hypothetical protein [Idotea baltica]
MTSTRQLKFSRLIQKELAEIFQKDQKSFFTDNIISVTQVEVTPDFSIAHVHLSLLLNKDKEKMLEVVEHHKGNIKHTLAKNIGKQIRKIPELIFHLDLGAEHAQRMDQILLKMYAIPTCAKRIAYQ